MNEKELEEHILFLRDKISYGKTSVTSNIKSSGSLSNQTSESVTPVRSMRKASQQSLKPLKEKE